MQSNWIEAVCRKAASNGLLYISKLCKNEDKVELKGLHKGLHKSAHVNLNRDIHASPQLEGYRDKACFEKPRQPREAQRPKGCKSCLGMRLRASTVPSSKDKAAQGSVGKYTKIFNYCATTYSSPFLLSTSYDDGYQRCAFLGL